MSTPLDDRELEGLLAARAGRARGDDEEVLLATTERIAREPQLGPGWATPRLVPGHRRIGWVLSVAAALVVGIGIGLIGPDLLSPAATTTPSGPSPSSGLATSGRTSSPSPRDPIDVSRVLSAEELGAALADGRLGTGATVLVDTALPLRPCRDTGACIDAARDGIPGALVVIRSEGPWPDEAKAIRAVRVTDLHHTTGRRILDLVAVDVQVGPDGGAWTVDALAALDQAAPTTVYAVRGWLATIPPLFRCGAGRPTSDPPRIEACGAVTDFLTPSEFQAVVVESGDIRVVAPEIAIGVAPGDYQAFAPVPALDRRNLPLPREGTFLVQITTPGGPLPLGRVVARIDATIAEAPVRSPTAVAPACLEIDSADCIRIADVAMQRVAEPVTITIRRYVPACIRAGSCMHGRGGYAYAFLVAIVDAGDRVTALGCTDDEPTVCQDVDVAEVQALVTLRLDAASEVKGVYLTAGGTTWGADPGRDWSLPAGSYQIAAVLHEPGDRFPPLDFPRVDALLPPEWCVATIAAEPGVVYDVRITVTGATCAIEFIDTGERRE